MDGIKPPTIKNKSLDVAKGKTIERHVAPISYKNGTNSASHDQLLAKKTKKRFRLRKKTKANKQYKTPSKLTVSVGIPKLIRIIIDKYMSLSFLVRVFTLIMAIIFTLVLLLEVFYTQDQADAYTLGRSEQLLKEDVAFYGQSLVKDNANYKYNAGYEPIAGVGGDSAKPKFSADFALNPSEGVKIYDPKSKVSMTIKPEYALKEPIKDNNRLIYPLVNNSAKKVYSLGGSVIKEDILLNSYIRDEMVFDYSLDLPDYLEPKLEKDGSIGVYGPENELLMGNVNTGTDKDAELLDKARSNSTKTKLIFRLPAPFIIDGTNRVSSNAKARFELKDNKVSIIASNLGEAVYPISIDPSVYIETAAKLMRGNNETNTDFDIDSELIQKSQTTGARIDSWQGNLDMSEGVWGQSATATGGYVYRTGGMTGLSKPKTVDQQISQMATNSNSFTMSMPATRPAGDLYLALMCHDGTGFTVNPPDASWNEYADLGEFAAYWKIGEDKSGGNEQASYTWTKTGGTGELWAGVVIRVSGFNAADPISGTPGTGSNAGNSIPVFPAVTPINDSTLIIRGTGVDADTPSTNGAWVPVGHTRIAADISGGTTANSCGFAAASLDASPAAGVSTGTATLADGSLNDTWGAASIAINPAGTPVRPQIQGQQTSQQATDSNSFTMSMPATRPAGDLYIALMCHDGTGFSVNPPDASWNEYADIGEHAAYWKIGQDKSGGNEQASYTWTKTGGTGEIWAGVVIRISGFDAANPISGTPGTSVNSGSDSRPTFPATTPTSNNTLIVRATGADEDPPSATAWVPANHTKIASGAPAVTNDCGYAAASMDNPPAAGVSTGTVLFGDTSINDTWGASSVAINPAPVAGAQSVRSTVDWARFNSSTLAIESPNPGTGVCASWCNDPAYDLPSGRRAHAMVAYNGYLYVMGGLDTGGNRVATIYVTKLGANGEPQLWHPTNANKDDWVYWYEDSGLSGGTAKSYMAAVAYNNKMYLLGGQTNASPGGVTTVEVADILPSGQLGAWTTSGMQALLGGAGMYMQGVHVYNNTLYTMGGFEGLSTSSGNLRNSVYYSKLNADGTMNAWQSTKSFMGGRATFGGTFSYIWGAYIYMGGGCTAVNGSGYCTAVAGDMQLASINADGSLDNWTSLGNLDNTRIGYSLIGWQGGIYRLGGCTAQSAGTGDCQSVLADVDYGVINPAGEVSTVNISEPSGTGSCSGTAPQNCNLPPIGDNAGQGGQMLSATTVLNGYLYVIGGCANTGCTNSSGNTSYASIGSDGSLQRPGSCSGTYYGSWCVDSTNRVNGTGGVSAAGVAVFNNRIYIVGGVNESADGSRVIYHNPVLPNGGLDGAWESSTFASAGISGEIAFTYAHARANPSAAGSNPGNLYIFGGCGDIGASAGCSGSNYRTQVYKCNIATSGSVTGCTTTGQLQIDSTPGYGGASDGLGIHSGTVYANYIFLIGGFSQFESDKDDTIYAKIDDNNNIVDANTGSSSGNWVESPNKLSVGRRRGWAFGYNGHIYSVGGYDASGGGIIPFIEWSKMNVSDGSINPFVTSGVTVNQRWGLSMVVNNSYAYVIGGCNVGASPTCSSFDATIQTFQLYNNNSGSMADFNTQSDQTYTTATDRWGASSAVLNGYLYVAGGCTSATDCTAVTDSVQYAPLSAADGSVGTWALGGNLPQARAWGSLEAAGGTLYYMGGQTNAGTAQSTVYYTSGISSGNPAWSGLAATNSLPSARTRFGSAVWDNRIYVVGGVGTGGTCTGGVCDTVYVSPKLDTGGNITSSWATSTPFNVDRSGAAVTAYANNLYLFGGHDGSNYLSDVQYTSLGYKTGTISQSGITVTGNGTTFAPSMVGSIIQYTNDGSTATVTGYTNATTITVNASKTVSSGSAYTIQDGSVSAWSYTKSLPGPLRDARAVSANGYIYLVGGRSANTVCLPKILVAPISANTTILSGNSPTGVGEWYETNSQYGGGRYGAAVEYINGKIYTMGGGCTSPIGPNYTTGTITQSGATVTGAGGASWTDNFVGSTITYADASTAKVLSVNSATSLTVSVSKTIGSAQAYTLSNVRHYYSAVNSQPQVAIYSRMIDTDTDVFPTKWLMNGIDNSVGARWQVRYRSMHDLDTDVNPSEDCGTSATMAQMTTWGQDTNFGDVTLGRPENYIPKNSSGGNINCARYFYFYVSIDASKTFGYPEDVNRGPTISDLSLFYTADPSKRMRHGKTFTGGEQQPLDTPF